MKEEFDFESIKKEQVSLCWVKMVLLPLYWKVS